MDPYEGNKLDIDEKITYDDEYKGRVVWFTKCHLYYNEPLEKQIQIAKEFYANEDDIKLLRREYNYILSERIRPKKVDFEIEHRWYKDHQTMSNEEIELQLIQAWKDEITLEELATLERLLRGPPPPIIHSLLYDEDSLTVKLENNGWKPLNQDSSETFPSVKCMRQTEKDIIMKEKHDLLPYYSFSFLNSSEVECRRQTEEDIFMKKDDEKKPDINLIQVKVDPPMSVNNLKKIIKEVLQTTQLKINYPSKEIKSLVRQAKLNLVHFMNTVFLAQLIKLENKLRSSIEEKLITIFDNKTKEIEIKCRNSFQSIFENFASFGMEIWTKGKRLIEKEYYKIIGNKKDHQQPKYKRIIHHKNAHVWIIKTINFINTDVWEQQYCQYKIIIESLKNKRRAINELQRVVGNQETPLKGRKFKWAKRIKFKKSSDFQIIESNIATNILLYVVVVPMMDNKTKTRVGLTEDLS